MRPDGQERESQKVSSPHRGSGQVGGMVNRERERIEICDLYKPPFNFKRTGCKGCPFSLDLQEQLSIMELYMPNERKQCELIWDKVYDEYRRIGYRLKKNEQGKLF